LYSRAEINDRCQAEDADIFRFGMGMGTGVFCAGYFRGIMSIARCASALTHFYRAIELDPQFAPAYGMAARAYAWRATNGWMTDITRETAEAQRLVYSAVELGKDDALALGSSGMAVARILGDLDYGARLIDRALALNPNLVSVWTSSGWVRSDVDTSIAHFERAIRLSPVDPQMFVIEAGIASAHFIAERIEDSATWAERALKGSADYGPALRIATASHALAGRAANSAQTLTGLQMADPALRLSNLRTRVPYRRNSDLERMKSGLRLSDIKPTALPMYCPQVRASGCHWWILRAVCLRAVEHAPVQPCRCRVLAGLGAGAVGTSVLTHANVGMSCGLEEGTRATECWM
jgi:tetratricopeptide (TPR) repeat protein